MIKIEDSLVEKNILITGAEGQIGSFLSSCFSKVGANVISADLNNVDVSSEKSVESFFHEKFTEYGKIDVLINNAGVPTFGKFENRTKEEFLRVLEINTWGTFNCIKNFSQKKEEFNQEKASIINVGSIYGKISPDFRIYEEIESMSSEVYGASKAGIIQITRHFATLLASRGTRVNCVSPGGVFARKNPQDSFFIKNYKERCPMKRMANPEDLVGIFFLLASDASQYITGQNIFVDGGFSSW